MANFPKISIIGGTFWGNRGAESMLTTTIGVIRQKLPKARFVVFSYYPKKDRSLVKDGGITILSGKPVSLLFRHLIPAVFAAFLHKIKMDLPKNKFFNIAQELSDSDLLLDIGGITFSDGREKFLPFNILTIWPSMILNVPVIKMAQAVGPFEHPINRLLAKYFLKNCRFIFVRGERSGAYLRDLGYPGEKTEIVADIAFLYEPEFSLTKENEGLVSDLIIKLDRIKQGGKSVVVISPSILVDNRSTQMGSDYSGRLLEAAAALGFEDYHFVVIPNATREESDKPHNNDLLTITKMKNRAGELNLPPEYFDWVSFDVNTDSIRKIIQKADILVTSRYHAMISGLCLSVPTLVVGWGHKYQETMAYFEFSEFSLDFERDEQKIQPLMDQMLENKTAIVARINKFLPSVKNMSKTQFDTILQILK